MRAPVRHQLQLIAVLLCAPFTGWVHGQQAAERFIPIGQSPGVSGESSYIGEIVTVDVDNRTLTVEDDSGRHRIRMTDDTDIWLDRSAQQRTNVEGGYDDMEVGRRVEIKPAPDAPETAAWIKIETR